MHAHRDLALARRLVQDQFPEWSALPIVPVVPQGHDNRTYRLGNTMCIRLPRAAAYAAHVATEYAWLPKLAPYLPLPIPLPLAMGHPAPGFPWSWLVNPWLGGVSTDRADLRDLVRFAGDLAHFLNALRRIDATGAPAPGPENFHRGGDLSVYADDVAACLVDLDAPIARRAEAVWQAALDARAHAPPVWVHGDVAADNLLIEDGRLAAVIDFGQLAAGDPACDVTVAWTLFRGSSRLAFKRALEVDEDTWRRGRGWALWKALLGLRVHRRGVAEHTSAWSVIDAILAEHGRLCRTTSASATNRPR